jgi:type VI secretion system secreted protein VgrG
MGLLGDTHQVLKIKTPAIGDDKLLVLRVEGREFLGRMPEYKVDLVGNVDMLGSAEDIEFDKILGSRANLAMELPGDDDKRHFDAFVIRIQRGERHGRYETFNIQLRPWLWFLTRRKNSRVFQAQSIKDILTKIFGEYSSGSAHDFRIEATLPKLDYCIQYNETDFDFVSRLLEEAGICYFFEHTDSKHTMVMVDAMAKHKKMPGDAAKIKWSNVLRGEEVSATNWFGAKEVRSTKAVAQDHDYLDSATKIQEKKEVETPLKNKMGEMEVYEFPANVVQNQIKPEKQPSTTAATQKALVMAETLQSMQMMYTGTTNARHITTGATFELTEEGGLLGAAMGALFGKSDPKRAGKYLVVGANYRIEFAQHEAIESALNTSKKRRDGFLCDVVCVNSEGVNFRPERVTPRPVMYGPQTAIVVGASGNEIETDKHGRVKVQFTWDREGKKDENSSCWIRVAQPHAGKGFGFWSVPRVGQEVVVSFLGGNPDRPLITGSVYNDLNTIAYELPKLATVSGWRTMSTKQGATDTYNELRFDDAKEKEYLWVQAQKDYYRNVKKNVFDMVGENETLKVKMTRKEVIGENAYLDVGKDVMQNIGKDLHTKVAGDVFLTGAATYQLKIQKEMSVEVGSDLGIAAKSGKVQIKAGADIVIEAQTKITLTAGGSSIVIGPSGVTIDGAMVKVNSGGGGGAASPKAPTDAKTFEELTKSEYDKQFEDPIPKK